MYPRNLKPLPDGFSRSIAVIVLFRIRNGASVFAFLSCVWYALQLTHESAHQVHTIPSAS